MRNAKQEGSWIEPKPGSADTDHCQEDFQMGELAG